MKEKNGFTLIELLGVILIIAILVGVSFLIFNNYGNESKEVVQKITDKSIIEAAELYVKEFKKSDKFWYKEEIEGSLSGNEYTCTTIEQLKNKGLLKGKLIDATTNKEIPDKTTIKVIRDNNKVIFKIEKDSLDCDTTQPTLTIEYEGNQINEFYTGEVNYIITPEYGMSGISEYKYTININGEEKDLTEVDSNYVYQGRIENNISGNIKICGYVRNGNDIKSETICKEIKVDNVEPTKPEVVANDNIISGNWHKNTFILNVSEGGTPISGKYYEYKKEDATEYEKVLDNKINIYEEDHNKTIYVRTCSNVLKCSEDTEYKVYIDKEKPVITNVSKNTNDYVTSIVINAAIKDNISGIAKYKIDTNNSNSGWTNVSDDKKEMSISKTVNSNGKYYILVEDKAGNRSETTINIDNIGTILTTTMDVSSYNSSTISDSKYISGIRKIISVTTNNGYVSNNSLSGNNVNFTVSGGTATSEPYQTTCSSYANSYLANSYYDCNRYYCPNGGFANQFNGMCTGDDFYMDTRDYYTGTFDGYYNLTAHCRNNISYTTTGWKTTPCPQGYVRDNNTVEAIEVGCNEACNGKPYNSTASCKGYGKVWCSWIRDYPASCSSGSYEYYCNNGDYLSGSNCYYCNVGSFNSWNYTCSYSCTQYRSLWSYRVTITYLK